VHLNAPTRELTPGDVLLVNNQRVKVVARSATLPRFPPRPLMYTRYANAARILPHEAHRLTFVLVKARAGNPAPQLAQRIQQETGLRARSSDDFKKDTIHWYLINSEDVGDMAAMLTLAMTVGFGVTGVMLYMFTYENLKQYAVLDAMGATPRLLLSMVFLQAGLCALLGTGMGIGLCALVGEVVTSGVRYPFRMMWFTPLLGIVGVFAVSLIAAMISVRPVLKMPPGVVFAGR
jgi:putative ABC transport system permease protein